MNASNLIFIPKIDHPETVSHYRPIILCNFAYKIVAKILVNRLKEVLEGCISENQRAFVLGRLIQDNSIIVHEAFHYLRRKRTGTKYEVALKMDMNKAYDRIEWGFLASMMERLGFADRWISKIMKIVW